MSKNTKAGVATPAKTNKSINNSSTESTINQGLEQHSLYKNIVMPNQFHAKIKELCNQGWKIVDVIPDDAGIIIFYGAPKSFKSFIALDIALSIAHGVEYHKKATVKGNVLYIAGEGQKGVLKRIEAWRQAHNIDHIEGFYLYDKPIIISEPKSCQELITFINLFPKDDKPSTIFVDTVARSMKGDENGSGMADFIAGCDELRSATNTQVIAIHHTPKVGDSMRGWSGLPGAVDFSYLIKKHSKRRMTASMTMGEVKDHDDQNQFFFDMEVHDIGIEDAAGKPITSLVPIKTAELTPIAEGKKQLSGTNLEIFNALLSAIEKSHKNGATLEAWKSEFFVTFTKSYSRQYFSRGHKQLLDDCNIFEDNGLYYPAKD